MEPMLLSEGAGGTLFCESVNPNGWSHCYLEDGNSRTFLGADDVEPILSRLLGVLGKKDELAPVTGQYNGCGVRCSLIHSEVHHVLNVADCDDERLLFRRNADDPMLPITATIRLSPEQRNQWMAQIKQISPNLWPSFQRSGFMDQKPEATQEHTLP